MNQLGVVAFLVVIVAVSALYEEELRDGRLEEYIDYRAPPRYKYDYAVRDPYTHDFKNQREHREGKEVIGEYSLLQPDGRRRIVEYRAGRKGAEYRIKYEGESRYGGIGSFELGD